MDCFNPDVFLWLDGTYSYLYCPLRLFRLYKSNAASPATRRSSAGAMSDGGGQSGGSANQIRRYSEQTQDTARASNTTGSVIRPSKRFSAGSVKTLKQIDKFMKRSSDVNIAIDERGAGVDEPIADLFLDTSIMFSDIVGELLSVENLPRLASVF